MKTRDVVFYSEGAKMAGTIYLPDDYKEGEKRAAVLCNSGWTGVNKCYPALYARALTAYGFVCMGFDYRGFKPSEDVHPCLPKYTTLETEVEDIRPTPSPSCRSSRRSTPSAAACWDGAWAEPCASPWRPGTRRSRRLRL